MPKAKESVKIKEDIKSGNFHNMYLVWGDEEFLRDFYQKELISKILDPDLRDFNYKEIASRTPSADEVSGFLDSYPCMSEKKVLFIKDSNIFKKATESDKEFWQNVIDEIPEYAVIIFSEKTVDKRSALYKSMTKKHAVDEFAFQERHDLINWIGRYLARYKKEITAQTAEYLIDCCSESMYMLKNEIEKLASYKTGPCITNDDIDICCCKTPQNQVFKMIDDALDGKRKEACAKLGDLKLLKAEPIPVNAAIFSKFNQFYKEKSLSGTMSAREIAAKTGQREYFVNMHLKQLSRMSLKDIQEIVALCAEADHSIKNGTMDGWSAIEIILAKILG